jgi:hypothetical protein
VREESPLTIPGLNQEDITTMLNLRSFEYYRQMVKANQEGICPFCNPMNPKQNRILERSSDGKFRMWMCPKKIRAKNLDGHFVIAPVRHCTDIGEFTSDDFNNLWLLTRAATRRFFGKTFSPHFSGENFGCRGVYAYVLVPNGKQRVEVIFDAKPNIFPPSGYLQSFFSSGNWTCYQCPAPEGLDHKFLIKPNTTIKTFRDITGEDFSNLSEIISYLTRQDRGLSLPGGAFIMGLPVGAFVLRFARPGEIRRNAGSIRHIHGNAMKTNAAGHIDVTLAKDAAKIAAKMTVLKIWEKMRLWLEAHPGGNEQNAMNIITDKERAILEARG